MASPFPRPAVSLFAAWLVRRNPQDPSAFQALLGAHPQEAEALRELEARWREIEPVLRLAARDISGEALAAQLLTEARAAEGGNDDSGSGTSDLLRRLATSATPGTRHRVEHEIARGGMGAILRVFDEELRRPLAMKVALEPLDGHDPSRAARFVEEAQVTGQLDHPGIVPVHELGLDPGGRLFFTMKLVRGRDLRAIYELVFEGREGWNETRAVAALLRVCEAVAYAHKKGVIHRDLKPANVMIGDLGEVYVMDWGLARVAGRPDRRDLRLAANAGSTLSVRTARRDEREETPDSPLVTMDGTVVGTPAYMPPEQARGEVERLAPQSDVYAIGAMLYHLLARRMPYVPKDGRVSNRTVLARVLDGPPVRVHELRAEASPELVAICEKAMDRDQSRRYADTLELAEDLRAYLEGRVVHAHAAGAVAELRKWFGRNRALAVSTSAAIVLALLGLTSVAWIQAARSRDLERANQEIRGLADMKHLQELRDETAQLWPALPARAADMERWLKRAEVIVGHRARHIEALERLKMLAAVSTPDSSTVWLRDSMAELVDELDQFAQADPPRGAIPEIRARLELARTIEARSVTGADAAARWRAAIESVRSSPQYGGLSLQPRIGLLPLGADPGSGLQEFAHIASGDPPVRGDDGALKYTDDSGIVLVLVPGGRFRMGSELDPAAPDFDPAARSAEGPSMTIALAPFYIGKHEVTQAQWKRIAHANPSVYQLDTQTPPRITPRNPVERISWDDAHAMMQRLGLALPTEAQWEYAARATTTTPWWTGAAKETIQGSGNIADATSQREGPAQWPHETWLEDGALVHTQVGSYRANPFGLHDVIGNVAEWCADGYLAGDQLGEPGPGDGVRDGGRPAQVRCVRGGSFQSPSYRARSAERGSAAATQQLHDVGVRAACPLGG